MKTIGILGGMSASSTILYYQILCELIRQCFGGLHSPQLLIRSLDFAPIAALQAAGDWDAATAILNAAALDLERGGADILLLATNTMHKVAEEMMKGVSVPLLHLADATASRIRAHGLVGGAEDAAGRGILRRPGLIATRFTMEQSFYLDRLRAAGLEPVAPDEKDREDIHRIIYDELCKGVIRKESEEMYVDIAERLVVQGGADCLILGCTEVGMLLGQRNVSVPVFDTTRIHCEEAVRMAMDV
ncbi:aspartate/glutamate racemase family protein [Pterulicium gracile]|uniref:Aspartate/glutamate racemase family protein n=1 Tax=Pterulicium gracile TaxID=1884261 RepID=A0A5C3QH59_9AGAR|nr:aspartate/glutamate racemase family protein [Pterula gracilis]